VQIIWQQQSGGVGGKFNVAGELSAAGTATSPCKYQLKIARTGTKKPGSGPGFV
jgi:hypothetical protein